MCHLFDERCVRWRPCQGVLRRLSRVGPERQIVALDSRVQVILQRYRIVHVALVHPAARGAIRRRERYQAHVRAVLIEKGG